MALKDVLKARPVIYEIVPPRRDTSRYSTELRGVEDVLHDPRIAAINVPELMNRRGEGNHVYYSPATIPPEEYAMMIKDYKESIINIVVPRMKRAELVIRLDKILVSFGIPNVVLVGKERHDDVLPGPGVPEALRLFERRRNEATVGGICIFGRSSASASDYGEGSRLEEPRRVWHKAKLGCDFATSQIVFDAGPAKRFLSSYQDLCTETGVPPLTVFISLSTIPSSNILALMERLDVVIPPRTRSSLTQSGDMGRKSIEIATNLFREIIEHIEEEGLRVPAGLHIEQVGTNSGDLSLELLDATYPILKGE